MSKRGSWVFKMKIGYVPSDSKTPEWIVTNIGLDLATFDGEILDIGCGEYAKFVEYGRRMHKKIDGVDPRLKVRGKGLMKCEGSSVPRGDNSYDLVFSHTGPFELGIKAYEYMLQRTAPEKIAIWQRDAVMPLADIVYEAVRLVRPGKDFIVFPNPDWLVELITDDLKSKGIESRVEPILDPEPLEQYRKRYASEAMFAMLMKAHEFDAFAYDPELYQMYLRTALNRWVVTKPGK